MKKIFLLMLLPLIVACGTLPTTAPDADNGKQGFASFATLSDSGNVIEQTASVVYTDLARYRYQSAQMLIEKRISKQRAINALTVSDAIRSALDQAVTARNLRQIKQSQRDISRELKRMEIGL